MAKIREVGSLSWSADHGLGGAIFDNLFGKGSVLHTHALDEGELIFS
jgi:hypothetical protein